VENTVNEKWARKWPAITAKKSVKRYSNGLRTVFKKYDKYPPGAALSEEWVDICHIF
jgi:hypothetical protein